MKLNTAVDYITTVFEYPVLTKTTGKPTYESLTTIKKELKANAVKFQCELGGANHGHLGILLSALEYTLVNLTIVLRTINILYGLL